MQNVVKINYVKDYPKDDNFILSVDRSAKSNELYKMSDDGLLEFEKSF